MWGHVHCRLPMLQWMSSHPCAHNQYQLDAEGYGEGGGQVGRGTWYMLGLPGGDGREEMSGRYDHNILYTQIKFLQNKTILIRKK